MLDNKFFKEEIQEVKKVDQQKEHQYLGTMKQHRGHTLFSINKKTKEIKKAEFEKQDFVVGQPKPNRKVIVDQDCLYINALNMKNLIKKLRKEFPSDIEEIKKVNSYG
jgi:hypothetical protein